MTLLGSRRFSRSALLRLCLVAVVVLSPLVVPTFGLIAQFDNKLIALRSAAAPRAATGDFVFVAIDKQSLDAIGLWPWPRSVYANLIDRLVAAEANDIFLDIDFSAPSRPEEDKRLENALSAAGGGVILPVFEQQASANDNSATDVSRPIAGLLANSWPAFANVTLSPEGLVRAFSLTGVFDGQIVQSVPAALAGHAQEPTADISIDYSIQPSTVRTYSLADVLSGKIGKTEIGGRSVVVGAYATELKDIFPVPVYGTLSGPMIHILAAETIVQGRGLWRTDELPIGVFVAALFVVLVLGLKSRLAIFPIMAMGAVAVVYEASAFVVQKNNALQLHTAGMWVTFSLAMILLVSEKFDLRSWLTEIARAKYRNTSVVLKRVVADSADAVIIFDEKLCLIDKSRSTETIFRTTSIFEKISIESFTPPALMLAVRDTIKRFESSPHATQTGYTDFDQTDDRDVRHLEAVITLSPLESPGGLAMQGAINFIGCLSVKDVTERHLYQTKLLELSERDQLTGALNRRALAEFIEKSDDHFSLFVVDLHRFAVLNATLGRGLGDDLLRAMTDRLQVFGGNGSAVGRLGGDVFCLARPTISEFDGATEAEALIENVGKPFSLQSIMIETTARVGVCNCYSGTGPAANWIEAAETALDEAKKIAGAGFKLYDHAHALTQARSRLLERELRVGLSLGQFYLLFQPQVNLQSGALVGAEALLRWKHPEFGNVSPTEFVEIAEANGFICELGRWALKEACIEASTWPADLHVAVNVSAVQLQKSDVVADVRGALEASGLCPKRLHLEITESMFVENGESLSGKLREIRDMGIKIALDDFGTGYSSLSYIADFPLDKLKIDQSFVRKMSSDPGSLAIVRAIVALADGIGCEIVCEGIEGEFEWKTLAALGCQQGQGYYFGRPQEAATFTHNHRRELSGKLAS